MQFKVRYSPDITFGNIIAILVTLISICYSIYSGFNKLGEVFTANTERLLGIQRFTLSINDNPILLNGSDITMRLSGIENGAASVYINKNGTREDTLLYINDSKEVCAGGNYGVKISILSVGKSDIQFWSQRIWCGNSHFECERGGRP